MLPGPLSIASDFADYHRMGPSPARIGNMFDSNTAILEASQGLVTLHLFLLLSPVLSTLINTTHPPLPFHPFNHLPKCIFSPPPALPSRSFHSLPPHKTSPAQPSHQLPTPPPKPHPTNQTSASPSQTQPIAPPLQQANASSAQSSPPSPSTPPSTTRPFSHPAPLAARCATPA